MTLEEAIKHCEEKAEELEKRVKPYQCESINKKLYEVNKKEWDSCIECAKEHRQLAEWLRELKAYRKSIEEVKKPASIWTEYDDEMSKEKVAQKALKDAKDGFLAIVDICLEEVNADDRN